MSDAGRPAAYRHPVDIDEVADAYAARAGEYIAFAEAGGFATGWERGWVADHLAGVAGPVLDLGCGPGQWTAHLRSLGVDATGVDPVPAFVEHARHTYPGVPFRIGSLAEPGVADRSLSGVLSWFSTIHLPPADLAPALAAVHRVLAPGGVLVAGFFAGEGVAAFDHAVVTAYCWPLHVFAERLTGAGFTVGAIEERRFAERPDRRYAAVAAHA